MNFRAKLLLSLVLLSVVTNGVSVVIMYRLAKHALFEEYRSKVLSIAATTAALLDGDLYREIRSRSDEGTPAYLKLKEQLRRARDTNRRHDTYVKYLFTFQGDPERPTELAFGVDPEEARQDLSHVGDLYRTPSGARQLRLDAFEAHRPRRRVAKR